MRTPAPNHPPVPRISARAKAPTSTTASKEAPPVTKTTTEPPVDKKSAKEQEDRDRAKAEKERAELERLLQQLARMTQDSRLPRDASGEVRPENRKEQDRGMLDAAYREIMRLALQRFQEAMAGSARPIHQEPLGRFVPEQKPLLEEPKSETRAKDLKAESPGRVDLVRSLQVDAEGKLQKLGAEIRSVAGAVRDFKPHPSLAAPRTTLTGLETLSAEPATPSHLLGKENPISGVSFAIAEVDASFGKGQEELERALDGLEESIARLGAESGIETSLSAFELQQQLRTVRTLLLGNGVTLAQTRATARVEAPSYANAL